ncbi:valyl-tRNA synthetase [Tistlia consotensis]|uniref:Valine--tRNA ligase n=1 Tax=Tistlia consotensis USBA 355 TaxID=560819 RepID=A0A1Y6BJQ0_9PROT|nr:valine--tRNA ligase [Tistlia consotensis]SMF14647.1 valyl-tRNA synthetase [Tistlia consotensis USBA 355]SNR49376.1 valyl-tRNA synthetase [Tistlia consotensis]
MAELDKTYRPQEAEARQYQRWEDSGRFACDPGSNARPYTIMMPPPNVTGSLHMGHALTFTIQDVLIRWHRMSGRDVLWQPGSDHAGIATQMVVERQLAEKGISRRDLGRERFVEKVWEWKAHSGGTINRQLRRLGASPDWARERFTMDEGLSHAVRLVFVRLHREGLIYRDKRLVNWDPKLLTAISDLEVQQTEVKGHLWHFRYPIEGEQGRFIVVATTRPETMLGDSAVAVHPDDPRYQDLIGRHAVLPLVGRRIPIVADEYADPETGSGAVKITPAHDFNDFEVGRRHGLEMINILDAQARLNDQVPAEYQGLDRYEARRKVVAALEAEGLLERIDDHLHMVPHGDRSGVAIEPWLTDQWYVDAKTLAQPCIEAVEQGRTVFVPKQWENVFFDWMRNIQPWCVSRQLWWGHQIPAWYGPDGQVFVEMDEADARAAARAHYGQDVALTRDEDVLDTWFSSGLWPFSTLGWPSEEAGVERDLARYYPGDVLVTGFDIIFFWVARMMMMGLHFMGEVPFRTVYIHALVRDQYGQKMSKSKGNIIDPLELIDEYGADALRFTLASLAVPGRDVKLAPERVAGYRNFATKLWNAARFCQINGVALKQGYDPAANRLTVDRWIVSKLASLEREVASAVAAYRLNDAAAQLYQFTWNIFCDWYIELAKPVLNGADEAAAAELRATAAFVMNRLLRVLHPFMPFLTEELWPAFAAADERLLMASRLGMPDELPNSPEAMREIDWLIETITQVRSLRAEMSVPPAAELQLLVRDAGPETDRRLGELGEPLRRLARLKEVRVATEPMPKDAVQFVVEEATYGLPLGAVIDVGAERQRLNKEIGKLDKELAKIEGKLGNEQFLAKAPEEVVAENREKRDELVATRDRLRLALARLESM